MYTGLIVERGGNVKDEWKNMDFGTRVQYTDQFVRSWKGLPVKDRRIAREKIQLLVSNPSHPSLNAHRIRSTGGRIWVCYISYTNRLLYQNKEGTFLLHDLGRHELVEKCHLRNYPL